MKRNRGSLFKETGFWSYKLNCVVFFYEFRFQIPNLSCMKIVDWSTSSTKLIPHFFGNLPLCPYRQFYFLRKLNWFWSKMQRFNKLLNYRKCLIFSIFSVFKLCCKYCGSVHTGSNNKMNFQIWFNFKNLRLSLKWRVGSESRTKIII